MNMHYVLCKIGRCDGHCALSLDMTVASVNAIYCLSMLVSTHVFVTCNYYNVYKTFIMCCVECGDVMATAL